MIWRLFRPHFPTPSEAHFRLVSRRPRLGVRGSTAHHDAPSLAVLADNLRKATLVSRLESRRRSTRRPAP